MRYESQRDVELRLRHSVVMCGGRPVVVAGVESVNNVIVQDIVQGNTAEVKVSDLDLSPASAKLGYIIADGNVLFGMRKPSRRYKQGLTQENLFTFNALKRPDDARFGAVRADEGRVRHHSSSVGRCILNEFPSIGDAFTSVREGRQIIMPFHREWAVAMVADELSLLHRGTLAGFATDTSVRLLPECFWLKESLSEALCE